MTSKQRGLTVKQEAFTQKLLACGNQREAYLFAYDVSESTSVRVVDNEASKLVRNPKVAIRLNELQTSAADAALFDVSAAVNELEAGRQLALELGKPSAAISATMAKAQLFGLGAKYANSGDRSYEASNPQARVNAIKNSTALIVPVLRALGYIVIEPDNHSDLSSSSSLT